MKSFCVVEGLWLRSSTSRDRKTTRVEVLAQIGGKWRRVFLESTEFLEDNLFSQIVEPSYIVKSPLDPVTERKARRAGAR